MSWHLARGLLAALVAMQALAWGLARGLRVRVEVRAMALGLAVPLGLLSPWLFGGELLAPTGLLDRVVSFSGIGHEVRRTHLLLSDPMFQLLPWELEVRHALRERRLPMWSDRLDGGSSPWLNPQAGALSPVAVAARLTPIQHFFDVTLCLKMLLAFEGTWLLVRRLGRSRVAALLAAASFALGGGVMSWGLFAVSSTVVWVPWLTLACVQLFRRPAPRTIAAAALVTAALLLSGHPEIALAGGLFAAVCGLALRRRTRRGVAAAGLAGKARLSRRAGRTRGLAAAGLAALLGFGLAAPVLVPFLRAVPASQRARDMLGAEMPDHDFRALEPASWFLGPTAAYLRSPINPRVYGLPYEEPFRGPFDWADALGGYTGLVAFAGAVVALFVVRDRRAWPFLGSALVILLLVAGFAPFAWLIYSVPALRVPAYSRFLPVACLGLAVAAAFGCDFMVYRRERRLQLAAALAAAAAISLLADSSPEILLVWGLVAGAALAARWGRRRQLGPRFAAVLLAAALALDLGPWARRLLPRGQGELFYPRSELIETLVRETGGDAWRVVGVEQLVYPSILPVYGLAEVRSNNALVPGDYLRVLRAAFGFDPSAAHYYSPFDHVDHPLLSFLNVRAVVSNIWVPRPRTLVPVAAPGIAPFVVYRNPAALPRWFVPAAVDLIERRALERWIAGLSEPGRVAVFRDEVARVGGPGADGRGGLSAQPADRRPLAWRPARLVAGVPGHLELDVPGAGNRLLATSLPQPGGWRARAGGRPLPKLTVDGAFLGVLVPAGASRVELDFTPPGFRSGLSACALALCALLYLAWRSWRAERAVTARPSRP
ncbi:MAG TPA: YfhO family protein [Thermoanaerobaculia bacterium]|nr:YfhO family protein [Thermoanaerobaculia bacterium]